VAQTAIELLFDRLAQPGQPARRQVVSMRFVPRDSAGARADDPERRKD
jgi:DNA-binding LacI/PurR family transcriptional regulator